MKQKKALKDFTIESLPHNRWQVFGDCFKLHWGSLLRLGFILLLFALPVIFVGFYFDLVGASYYEQLSAGTMTEDVYLSNAYALQFIKSIASAVAYCIFAVGLSGAMRVIRQMVWAEPLFFKEDFWTGVKLNWGNFVFCAGVIGVVGVYNAFVQSAFTETTILTSLPLGIEISVIVPTILYIATQTIVYTSKLGPLIKNGFLLYIKTFPVTILFTALFTAVFAVELITVILVKYIVLAVIILVYIPLVSMGWILYSFSAFDKFINKDSYPSIYRKGIFDIENN